MTFGDPHLFRVTYSSAVGLQLADSLPLLQQSLEVVTVSFHLGNPSLYQLLIVTRHEWVGQGLSAVVTQLSSAIRSLLQKASSQIPCLSSPLSKVSVAVSEFSCQFKLKSTHFPFSLSFSFFSFQSNQKLAIGKRYYNLFFLFYSLRGKKERRDGRERGNFGRDCLPACVLACLIHIF